MDLKISDFDGSTPKTAWMRKIHFVYISDKNSRKMIERKEFGEYHYWLENNNEFILLGRSVKQLFTPNELFNTSGFISNLITNEKTKDRWKT